MTFPPWQPETFCIGEAMPQPEDIAGLVALPHALTAKQAEATATIEEFFIATLRNPYTRTAYLRACRQFFRWCRSAGVGLDGITPALIGRYLDGFPGSVPTAKQHLAALRGLFDLLVVRQVVPSNPAASVRAGRYSQTEGKTTEASVEQVNRLLSAIDLTTVVGQRDRAILGVLNFTGARVGAVASLRRKHLVFDGSQYLLHFHEKNSKQRAIPVRHDLQQWLLEYLKVANAAELTPETKNLPLFQVARGKGPTAILTEKPLTAEFMARMMKRRCRACGLPPSLTPHSFRVKTATNLLQVGVPLEDVQYLLGHSDPRTTRLYDRRAKQVTRNIVERIPT